jgi:uncharacterized protein (DUF1330 family)
MNRANCSGTWNARECGARGRSVQSLHAQAKPPVYLVAVTDVANPEAYGKEFAIPAQANIRNAGGKFLAIGGAGAGPVTAFDGEAPKRVVITAWDSLEKVKAWYNSAEYQNIHQAKP